MSQSENQKKLAFAICDFLAASIKNGVISQDDSEGIEVAVQCIGEAFGVDPADLTSSYSIKPQSLASIFDVFLNTQKKVSSAKAETKADVPAAKTLSAAQKAKAEELKGLGNKKMGDKKYQQAIDHYTQAIAIDDKNAVYWGNRAAAYSQLEKHSEAAEDSQNAINCDPEWAKGYSRLGHAQFCLGNYTEAVEAYEKGLELDPGNQSMKQSLSAAQAKAPKEENVLERTAPADPMAGLGGMPGMGGPGGMDFASMMNNPAFMSMAQNMMSNPAMASMMQNPAMQQAAQQMMQDPSKLSELMSDPNVANMAKQFMGGKK